MTTALFWSQYACDPYFNMAADEWLFARACATPASIYMRLYTWSRGGITFGFNQKVESALDISKATDTPVIRRITGGRALYHDRSELTYSISINTSRLSDGRLAGSATRRQATVAQALVGFLDRLGIQAEFRRRSALENSRPDFFHKAPCFASHAKYEVVSDGRKVVASAARQHGCTVLQHGALKLNGLAHHPALDSGSDCPSPTRFHLQPVSKEQFAWMSVLFVRELGERLGVEFSRTELTGDEMCQIDRLSSCLKDNALSRRDPIKHKPVNFSL